MAHQRFVTIVSGVGMLLLGCLVVAAAQEPEDCTTLQKNLVLKHRQLSQHVDALKKLNDQHEFAVMAVFNEKIRELIEEIRRMESAVHDCPKISPPEPPPGLGKVKSDLSEYATKTCDELRNLFLQLVQKTSALKRREGSLFSALTSEEKAELEDAEGALKELKAAIRSRCASRNEHSPFRRRRR